MVHLHRLAVFLGFISCLLVSYATARSYTYRDPILEPHLFMFEAEAKKRGIILNDRHLTLLFGKMDKPGDIGFCTAVPNSDERVITIDESYWMTADPTTKMLLIFHECSHCILGLDHRHIGVHIMSPVIMYPWQYKEWMLDEVFDDYKHHNFTWDHI